jgi:hypothetical protein
VWCRRKNNKVVGYIAAGLVVEVTGQGSLGSKKVQ